MKKTLIIAAVLLVAGCRSSTEFGQCKGLFDDSHPELKYELSTRNAVIAVMLSETVVVPVLWAYSYAACPVGRKP